VRSIARHMAQESWGVVQEVACIWTLARRRATDELLFNAAKEGTARAVRAITESGAVLRPKKGSRKVKDLAKTVSKKQPRKTSKGGDNAQFFLTEFDDGTAGSGDDSDNEEGSAAEASGADEGGSDGNCWVQLWQEVIVVLDPALYAALTEEFLPSPTRASVRFFNKERASIEDLTASALAALRLSKRQRPVKVYDPAVLEHK
jgi:hypothetical protein